MKILKPIDKFFSAKIIGEISAFAICKNQEDDIVVLYTKEQHGDTVFQCAIKYLPPELEDEIVKISEGA